jgi:outer membrane protein assembly factor BamE (lipoprotein component of BamABCDE complex)
MKKKLVLLISLIFITNCTLNKVVNHHGVHFLEKKHKKLNVKTSNSNDIIKLLGPPSVKSTFDENLWIYVERRTTTPKVAILGEKILLVNNVLVLEIDSGGLLSEKIFLDKTKMNQIDFNKDFTKINYTNRTFLYDFFSTMRKKMNDPLGKKSK